MSDILTLVPGQGARHRRAARTTRSGRPVQILVDAGAVTPDYIDAMFEREKSVSTYMGNFLAIPHGTNEAKDTIKTLRAVRDPLRPTRSTGTGTRSGSRSASPATRAGTWRS